MQNRDAWAAQQSSPRLSYHLRLEMLVPKAPKPLTPTLSPSDGERENRRQRVVQSQAADGIISRWRRAGETGNVG